MTQEEISNQLAANQSKSGLVEKLVFVLLHQQLNLYLL